MVCVCVCLVRVCVSCTCVCVCLVRVSTEKCRSEEDLKGMDSRNKITQDMLQPKVDRSLSDEEGSSDYLFEFSDNDSDWSDNRYTERTILYCFAIHKSNGCGLGCILSKG